MIHFYQEVDGNLLKMDFYYEIECIFVQFKAKPEALHQEFDIFNGKQSNSNDHFYEMFSQLNDFDWKVEILMRKVHLLSKIYKFVQEKIKFY